MSNKIKQNYEELAISLGLHCDGEGIALYGQRDGYELTIFPEQASYPYMLSVVISAQRPPVCSPKTSANSLRKNTKLFPD